MPSDNLHIRELLSQASELPADQRDGFLSRACGDDAGLQREVHNLLAMLARADDFMSPAQADRPSPPDPEPANLEPFAQASSRQDSASMPDLYGPGTLIGPYRVCHILGEGGFGTVYLVEQDQPVRRQVALKVIKPGMDTRQIVRRFKSERQTLAMMDHPNIAKVLDAGSTAAGRPYFVMELVRGMPITEYCRSVRASLSERLALFIQVCNAIQHAHQKGVIHRDLKPTNVLVTMSDGKAIPKVIDFGVAKAIAPQGEEVTTIDGARHWTGTPQYMSPEQTGGIGPGDIDTRSDVYSLGVLLYELLAGRTPFDSRELRGAPPTEVQRIICHVDPRRPSTAIADSATGPEADPSTSGTAEQSAAQKHKLSQRVRGELDWIVMRCIAKDRSHRYQTANALAQDVEHYLRGEPISAGPPSSIYRVKKFVGRHKPLIGGVSVLAAALVLGSAGTTVGLLRERKARAAAVTERDLATRSQANAMREAAKAAAVNGFLLKMLSSADPDRARGKDLMVRDILEEASRQVHASPPTDLQTAAAIQHTLGITYNALGLYGRATDHLQAALNLQIQIHGTQDIDVARNMGELADNLWDDLHYTDARPLYLKSLELRQQLLGPDSAEVASAIERVANMNQGLSDYQAAEANYQKALAIRRKVLGDDNLETAHTLMCLSMLQRDQGRRAPAEAMLNEALKVQRKVLGDDYNRTIGHTLFLLGTVAETDPQCRAAFEQALAVQQQALGHDHPDVALTMFYLSLKLLDLGDYGPRTEALLKDAIRINTKALGPVHGQIAKDLQSLALLYLYRNQLPESQSCFAQSLSMFRQTMGDEAGEIIWVLRDMIPVMVARHEFAKVEELLVNRNQWVIDHAPQNRRSLMLKQVEMQLVELYQHWDQPAKLADASARFTHDFPEGIGPPNPSLTPVTLPKGYTPIKAPSP